MPTFNADTIIAMALRQAGNREGSSELVTAAESELNLIIFELEEDPNPYWFQLTEWSTTATEIGEPRVNLPGNFLMEDNDSHLYVVKTDGTKAMLIKDDSDALRNKFLNGSNALPTHYAVTGEYFELFPTPDKAYTIEMRYYKRAADLTTTVRTNVWTENGPDLLIAMLGQKMIEGYLQENNASSKNLEKAEARARRRLRAKHVAREVANEEMTMGD